METVVGLIIIVVASAVWYAARKLSSAENAADAGEAEAEARKALEEARAREVAEEEENDKREASEVAAGRKSGIDFLRDSFKRPN